MLIKEKGHELMMIINGLEWVFKFQVEVFLSLYYDLEVIIIKLEI